MQRDLGLQNPSAAKWVLAGGDLCLSQPYRHQVHSLLRTVRELLLSSLFAKYSGEIAQGNSKYTGLNARYSYKSNHLRSLQHQIVLLYWVDFDA